ncbi:MULTISPECIES: hypothetical protein [Nonomuraea]|uniref:HEAT repeat domain-containing protein n=1 Tax=Nonomuraea ferruginea TaxID=46174 RepID=A0ABT4T144_9ACTN|nr:hypothetical protein [Nonomuraea ferruginea]MDA0643105.1 hypothetical protein [Nonomuraea ferruginea]
MTDRLLYNVEVERHDWPALTVCGGTAVEIPQTVEAMLSSSDADEVERHYWQLENRAVVQGQLYSSAPPLVSVLIAALLGELSRPARIGALELLYQLVTGTSHPEEAEAHPDLGDECQKKAREGLWVLYRELLHGESDAAKDILDVIETDPGRLRFYLAQLVHG